MLRYFQQLYRKDPSYLNHLEGLRALSAIWVMLYHVAVFASVFLAEKQYVAIRQHPFFKIALSSSVSLDIFFVISGLVIGYTLIKELKEHRKVELYRFFVRRCSRVYPLYLTVIVITLPFYYPTIRTAWANILQINNMLPIDKQHLIWTWSLAIDFQFYALFTLILWLIAKQYIGRKACYVLVFCFFILPFIVTSFLISVHDTYHVTPNAYRIGNPEWGQFFRMGFDNFVVRCGPILYGVLTAFIMVYHSEKLQEILQSWNNKRINILTLTLIALMFLLLANDPIWFVDDAKAVWQTSSFWVIVVQRNVFSFLVCLILLLATNPQGIVMQLITKMLNLSVWRPMAQLTYATYLLHPVVFLFGFFCYFIVYDPVTVTAQEYFKFGLVLMLLCYIIAVPFYLFVEQPGKDYFKHILVGRRFLFKRREQCVENRYNE